MKDIGSKISAFDTTKQMVLVIWRFIPTINTQQKIDNKTFYVKIYEAADTTDNEKSI